MGRCGDRQLLLIQQIFCPKLEDFLPGGEESTTMVDFSSLVIGALSIMSNPLMHSYELYSFQQLKIMHSVQRGVKLATYQHMY